jgi:hypothetical protein
VARTHSPSFTLDTYVHLLDKDLGRPLEPLWVKEKPGQGPEKRRKRDSRRIRENGGLAGKHQRPAKHGALIPAHNPKVAGSNPAPL